ncbi:MAG: hypothetical protein ACRC5C_12840, partial [Bacilli bacterium]
MRLLINWLNSGRLEESESVDQVALQQRIDLWFSVIEPSVERLPFHALKSFQSALVNYLEVLEAHYLMQNDVFQTRFDALFERESARRCTTWTQLELEFSKSDEVGTEERLLELGMRMQMMTSTLSIGDQHYWQKQYEAREAWQGYRHAREAVVLEAAHSATQLWQPEFDIVFFKLIHKQLSPERRNDM